MNYQKEELLKLMREYKYSNCFFPHNEYSPQSSSPSLDNKGNSNEFGIKNNSCNSTPDSASSIILECRKKGWNKQNSAQCILWMERIHNFQIQIQQRLRKTNLKLTILTLFVVILSTLSSGLSFFNVGVNSGNNASSVSFYISIVIGSISLMAAIVSSIQSSLGYDQEVSELKRATIKFCHLERAIESVLNSECRYKPYATPWIFWVNQKFTKYHEMIPYIQESFHNINKSHILEKNKGHYHDQKQIKNNLLSILKKWHGIPEDLTDLRTLDDDVLIELQQVEAEKSKNKKEKEEENNNNNNDIFFEEKPNKKKNKKKNKRNRKKLSKKEIFFVKKDNNNDDNNDDDRSLSLKKTNFSNISTNHNHNHIYDDNNNDRKNYEKEEEHSNDIIQQNNHISDNYVLDVNESSKEYNESHIIESYNEFHSEDKENNV